MRPVRILYSEDTVLELAILERRALTRIRERMAVQQGGEDFRCIARKALGTDAEREAFAIAKSGLLQSFRGLDNYVRRIPRFRR